MKNKTILITGSTDGIGRETAMELAQMGHKVLIHGRDRQKTEKVMDEIKRKSGNDDLSFYVSDFADLESIVKMADEIRKDQDHLDVLINNAGVFPSQHIITKDGNELTFQVNYLAHFLLTHLLLDLIKNSAPARIIHVASTAHYSADASYFNDLKGDRSYSSYSAYSFSKLANILFSNELAERLKGTGVTSNSLHPGTIHTKLLQAGFSSSGRSVEDGAQTPVYLATSKEVEGVTGKYFSSKREKTPSDAAQDTELQKKLWKVSEELLKKYLSDRS